MLGPLWGQDQHWNVKAISHFKLSFWNSFPIWSSPGKGLLAKDVQTKGSSSSTSDGQWMSLQICITSLKIFHIHPTSRTTQPWMYYSFLSLWFKWTVFKVGLCQTFTQLDISGASTKKWASLLQPCWGGEGVIPRDMLATNQVIYLSNPTHHIIRHGSNQLEEELCMILLL